MSTWAIVHVLLHLAYGVRLFAFIFVRDFSETYRKRCKKEIKDAGLPVDKSFMFWIFVMFMYQSQFAPALFHVTSGPTAQASTTTIVAIVAAAFGLFVEALADHQKSAHKRASPTTPITSGLFALCRCPNYAGEVLFYTANFVAGLQFCGGWLGIAATALGWLTIVSIMADATSRMIKGQHERYATKVDGYAKYEASTKILVPYVF